MHPLYSKLDVHVEDHIRFFDPISLEFFTIELDMVLDLESFRALLLKLAKDTPGEEFIRVGRFRILDGESREIPLSAGTWQNNIRRGTHLYQSIEVKNLVATTSSCPRPGCPSMITYTGQRGKW